jgi:hypothetical protein
MAIYITDRRSVADGDNTSREIIEYTVDELGDITGLPGNNVIKEGSTAFVINTSQVFMLGGNGWKEI